MLEIGSKAPDFTLPDDTGRMVGLRDLVAKGPVVLMFYPSDGTPLCTKEACVVRDRFDELAGAGVTVAGISAQGSQSKASFRKSHGLRHVLLADAGSKVAATYKARGVFGLPVPFGTLRVSYIVGADGVVADRVHNEFSVAAHEALLERAVRFAERRPA
jgi:peroxiredoxin Q/BCP